MRDFLIVLIIFGSIPFIIVRPAIGVLVSTWITYMAPHKLTWDYAFDMPVALIIGVVTVVAWLISSEAKRIPWAAISILMLLYAIWTNITTVFALVPELALKHSIQFDKIMLLAFLSLVLMQTEKRLRALVWVIVASISYYAVKGGVFGILTGLQSKVWGPPGGFFEDNNALAMAIIVTLPLLYYLSTTVPKRLFRWAIWLAIGLSLISVIGSYSRGAFLGLIALGIVWLFRSKRRYLFGGIALVLLIGASVMVPERWIERINSIEKYEEDGSATGRIEAMQFGLNVANSHPFTGGGFGVFGNSKAYEKYGPGSGKARSAHNIYFQVLGSQGYVGFILFVSLAIAGLSSNQWVRKRTRNRPDLKNEYTLADMCWLSMIAFGACGMFQNAATWDLPYTILIISLLNNLRVKSILKEERLGNTISVFGATKLFNSTVKDNAYSRSPEQF